MKLESAILICHKNRLMIQIFPKSVDWLPNSQKGMVHKSDHKIFQKVQVLRNTVLNEEL